MADKNIITVNEIPSVDDSDKVFVNDGNTLKQITVKNLMKKVPSSSGGGTTDYNDLTNQPQLNGVTLEGNKTLDQIGAVQKNQGSGNSGKYLSVGSDGNVTLSDAPSGGTVDPEQIKQAVNGYLEENPVSGMTEEQEQQLNQNIQDVADLKSAIKNNSEKIASTSEKVEDILKNVSVVVNLNEGDIFAFNGIRNQEIKLNWKSKTTQFVNGINYKFPLTVNKGYTQIAQTFFGEQDITYGQDIKNGCSIWFHLNVPDNAIVTSNAVLYKENLEMVSIGTNITTGWYLSTQRIVSNLWLNFIYLQRTDSSTGICTIDNAYGATIQDIEKIYALNDNTDTETIRNLFLNHLKPSQVGNIGFNESPKLEPTSVSAYLNDSIFYGNTDILNIADGDKLTVESGMLSFRYYVTGQGASGGNYSSSISVWEKNEILFPYNIQSETVKVSWEQSPGENDGNYFVNGAKRKTEYLPMQLPASYTQVGTLFLEDVIKEAYEGKGNDDYGTVYGLFTLDISEGDSITYLGANCYDAKTKQLQSSPITESGSYYFELLITVAQATANRPAFKSELGTSTLLSIQAQTKSWASIVSDEYTGKITEFMELFPFETIKDLQLGESLIPQKTGGAEAIVFSNEKEQVITESDNNITIAPNCKILVKKGTLKIEYPLNNDIKIEERKWCNIKWACIGDSYTDTSINATYKYEQIIHDKTGINFQMLGVGGTGWWKGYDTQTSYRFRAAQVEPDTDVVTIFGSINDWKYSNSGLTIGTPEDTLPTQSFCAYINDVFDALIEACPTAQVIVFSPMYYHGLSNRVPELFDAVKSVTEKRGFEYVDMLNTGWLRIENNDAYAQKYCTDFGGRESYGHPNNLAHKTFIAPKFYAKLKEYIEM